MINKRKTKKIKNLLLNPKKIFNYLSYNEKNETDFNINALNNLGCNIENIKKRLKNFNLDFSDKKLSWHYHLFSGLELNNLKMLEIGTYDGTFANYIASTYDAIKFYTIDLKSDDANFINSYNRKNSHDREKFLLKRDKNINHKNIIFYEINSTELPNKFEKDFFDIIWIDGDHHNPQVTIDIHNSLNLVKQNGLICCDDIIMTQYKDSKVSNESYQALNDLERKEVTINKFILKRVNKNNVFLKKYISISKKILNK